LSHVQWTDLKNKLEECKAQGKDCKSVVGEAAKKSQEQDAILATCDLRGDCLALKAEVDKGTRGCKLDCVNSSGHSP
jgi:hypothetical protein